MVNGGTREICADGDRLEGGGVVAKFAEDLTSRLYDALSRFSSLRCGRATRSSTRGMLRHGQIVPQLTRVFTLAPISGHVGTPSQQIPAPIHPEDESFLGHSHEKNEPRRTMVLEWRASYRGSRTSRSASKCCRIWVTAG